MPVDSGVIANQVGAAGGLWTHTPVDWRGNEPPGTARPGGWPTDAGASTAVAPNGSTTSALAPAITAISASGMTATTVNINYTLSAQALNWVDYGLTTAYGTQNTLGTGTGPQVKGLAGLTTVTTYHYRIGASANGITTYSTDRTFVTV
jgi:hypothetical protein